MKVLTQVLKNLQLQLVRYLIVTFWTLTKWMMFLFFWETLILSQFDIYQIENSFYLLCFINVYSEIFCIICQILTIIYLVYLSFLFFSLFILLPLLFWVHSFLTLLHTSLYIIIIIKMMMIRMIMNMIMIMVGV